MKYFWLRRDDRWAAFHHVSRNNVHVVIQGDHLINKKYTRYGAQKLWGNLRAQGWARVYDPPHTFAQFLATIDPTHTNVLQSSSVGGHNQE